MCAGPIVQAEMGISSAAADVLENMMLQVPSPAVCLLLFDAIFKGYELLRPGVVRLCLHYCSR